MRTETEATIEDLERVPGKAELVNGEIVYMSPAGGLHGYVTTEIVMSLNGYAKRTGRGYAIGDNIGFIVDLPNRKSFCPDASYYIGELTMKFLSGAPVFAVEIRSPEDYGPRAERKLADKRADYFAAGTQVVWDVDLVGDDTVRVYRASDPQNAITYRRGQLAEAEPAVPGWTIPVDDMLPNR